MIMLPRPSTILIKSEIYKPPLSYLLNFAGQLPVHRGTPDRTALQAGLAVLRGGGALGMFPEGTRGTGELTTIQHGIGYLALNGRCPVVPVVCQGTAAALPKGKVLPRWRAPIEVVFGPAFTVDVAGDPRARTTIAAAAEQVRLGLLEHLRSLSEGPAAGGARSAGTAAAIDGSPAA
jgi:1-acyl-sn-glycerol-3-phosphate acyltransferase